ncbi:uncharacterized protein LOC131664085 [Phymastichus coffea]|uniref:uncharacterized protein LOC131664085 n=1 Tax=Phymastichus coffea TaxID=108790 RepID=UPI00273A9C45|nr:uncharacterized protein LOC131664085 [Phymastichus coffea]
MHGIRVAGLRNGERERRKAAAVRSSILRVRTSICGGDLGCGARSTSTTSRWPTSVPEERLAYSSLWAVGFACTCSYGLCPIARSGHETDLKIVALAAGRTLLAYVCFFSDAILSIRWNERLRTALLLLRSFDAAVDYNLVCPSTWTLRTVSWPTVITVILFWLSFGYITYKCEMTSPLLNAIVYVVANAAISMQLIKFAGLMVLLHRRFKYMHVLLQAEGEGKQMQRREMRLQEVWWLHYTLSNAADMVNSIYSVQLLFWLATMWLNALSRIYAISESLAATARFLPRIRQSLLVTAYVVNLLIITTACHCTAHQANTIGKATFKPETATSKKRHSLEQSVEVGIYFNLRQLHFSAAGGFIFIDLPLLISITGTMTTYLVVLHNNT